MRAFDEYAFLTSRLYPQYIKIPIYRPMWKAIFRE